LEDLKKTQKTLEFKFKLPQDLFANDESAIVHCRTQIEFVVAFLDVLGQKGKLNPEVTARLDRLRETAAQKLQKVTKNPLDELQKKKAAEKKAREEAIAKLSPEQQRKIEEKDKRKEMKKQMKKQMKGGKVIMK
jgi:hypothetical protein